MTLADESAAERTPDPPATDDDDSHFSPPATAETRFLSAAGGDAA